jgi:alpha-galactosidase
MQTSKRLTKLSTGLLALVVGCIQVLALLGGAPASAASSAHTTSTPATSAAQGQGVWAGDDRSALAATPPMGWNDWYTFYCNVNEDLVKQTADAMVSSGMRDAGYKYVNLDDCWAGDRDADGNMTVDPVKFPHGMKALADYVHARGLKLGVYTDVGTKTCAGYEAGYGNEKRDVDTFASWGVDFVKVDWCNIPWADFPGMTQQQVAIELYGRWAKAFDEAARPMFFSMCVFDTSVRSWEFAPKFAQMWRTSHDYGDSWDLIMRNGDQAARLHDLAGPGGWNDPDILMVGHGQLSNIEYQTQFSVWSMAAAPLLAGNDLRTMSDATRSILTNREVIAIDQDPLGDAGRKLRATPDEDVWVRSLANGDQAVLLVNRSDRDRMVSTTADDLGLAKSSRYSMRDLWQHRTLQTTGTFSAYLPPHASRMLRISSAKGDPTAGSVTWGAAIKAGIPGLDANVAAPGSAMTVEGLARNDGTAAIEDATVGLEVPEGWTVSPDGPRRLGLLRRDGGELSPSWTVTPPADAAPGRHEVTSTLSFSIDGVQRQQTYTSSVIVPKAPPAGVNALSDLDWIDMSNGYGPPLKDRNYYGDTLSIGGQTYAKGIWNNADAHLGYYLGAKCSRFTTDVGIDDSKTGGSVVFEIYVDGNRVYRSDVLTGSDPAAHADVDVTGAKSLRIAVTDAGDGVTNDNADWGGPTLTCG